MTAPASEADGEAVRSALGVRAGMRIWVGGHAIEARRAIERHLSGTTRPPRGPLDAAFICPKTPDEAEYFAAKLRPRLKSGAIVWLVEPGMAGEAHDSNSPLVFIDGHFAARR